VTSIRALDPSLRISQYGHNAWRVQDGVINAGVAITQTSDGYIWFAGSGGLVRFDGVNFVPWSPPKGQSLPSAGFSFLLGSRDGSLWIGTPGGLSRWRDGQLQNYTNHGEHTGIAAIIEDHAGTIWVTRYRIPTGNGPLCRVEGKELRCFGKADGIPVKYGQGLAEDNQGDLWFGSSVLCQWRPGSSANMYLVDELKGQAASDGVIDVAIGTPGSVWAAIDGVGPRLGVRHSNGGKWASYVVPGFDGAKVRSHTLFVDRNKSLWIGTENNGMYHIRNGVADHFGSSDGLSGNSVFSIYEDHEGNLWVVTDGGIDVFRETPVISFSMREGLSASDLRSIVATRDNSVLIGNQGALDILRRGRISSISVNRGLPGQNVEAMFEDHTGLLWLGIDDRLMIWDHGQFREVKRPDGRSVRDGSVFLAITEDVEHNIWALTFAGNLLRIADGTVREAIPLDSNISRPRYLANDREGGVWISSLSGSLTHYQSGHFQTISFGNREHPFSTYGLFVDSDNSVLIPTARGLFRWKDGRINVLDIRNGLPCDLIYSGVIDNHGSLWLYTACGLLRIEASELAKWRESPESHVAVRVFDALDGAQPGLHSTLQPKSSKGPDGRLWFISGLLAQTIDPDRLHSNSIPAPVHIEEVVAEHKKYEPQENLRLPALTRELEIDYTALSFSVPRKVRFRYRLEGNDSHWEEPGTRRQAFYSDLGPGKYRFRVVACNNDGLWNNVGATLDFSIAPAWYQTYMFRALCIVTGVFFVWVAYRLRVRQISRAINARFDERLVERTRLARELHDTLLQTIQGSKMVADDALDQSTDSVRMRRAMERLSEWLGQSMQEVRTALNSLRTSTTQGNDLAEGLERATEDCLGKGHMKVSFSVIGTAREMHPIVRDEIYRIGYESIHNACMHANGSRLEVELTYARDLIMRVKDDGVGIDRVVAEKGREGHFGLQGMRERATRIGATFTLVSSATFGTEITLLVPGGAIFQRQTSAPIKKVRRFFRGFRKTSRLD
jgi:signal transduction histidine kinase/ligand-binding sensor domain-containing protein